jgi:hypothetical protein
MKKVKGRIRIDVRKCVNKIAKRREQVLARTGDGGLRGCVRFYASQISLN